MRPLAPLRCTLASEKLFREPVGVEVISERVWSASEGLSGDGKMELGIARGIGGREMLPPKSMSSSMSKACRI